MMQPSTPPITQDLVLIGGGHSHAIALRMLGMNPLPGVRLTLITDVIETPYSGMLPGYVAGLYSYDACHIDLRPLANFAGAQLVHSQAIGLDLQQNRVLFADRPAIAFDLLSIDIGSTPSLITVPGAAEYAIPVKPVSKFLAYWDELVEGVKQNPGRSLQVGVVGGGAGGVELILSVQARLQQILQQAGQPLSNLEFHLIHRGHAPLEERGKPMSRKMTQILTRRGIHLHLKETVSEVGEGWLRCESGLKLACDRIFWVTQAGAAQWLAASGLATDSHGFLRVNDQLQSISHPQVFAAGDVATMVNHPRPKAGVFAVRQGKPLYENLRRALLQQPLQSFQPQQQFLILVGLGDRTAVASRGDWSLGAASWIWRWKDQIDRQFMAKFEQFPTMNSSSRTMNLSPEAQPTPPMRCAGCGSKVGSSVLERSLQRVQAESGMVQRPDVLIGLEAADDAAAIYVPSDQVLVQTVDYFRALVNDPFVFAQIATLHCLSDLFAMGATPQTALAIATLPYAVDAKAEETLYQLLSGVMKVLNEAGAALIGGHTSEGAELALGLTCNGLAQPHQLLRKGGIQPDQALILTKPLGTGTLFAAEMQRRAKGRWIEAAIESMLGSNQTAAACLRSHHATTCTDITGFGLLGHLAEMLRQSSVAVELNLNALPLLEGVRETLQQGIFSSLYPQNLKAAHLIQNLEQIASHSLFPICFDPQTSGGLLAAVPLESADACLNALQAAGYPHSAVIGRSGHRQEGRLPIELRA